MVRFWLKTTEDGHFSIFEHWWKFIYRKYVCGPRSDSAMHWSQSMDCEGGLICKNEMVVPFNLSNLRLDLSVIVEWVLSHWVRNKKNSMACRIFRWHLINRRPNPLAIMLTAMVMTRMWYDNMNVNGLPLHIVIHNIHSFACSHPHSFNLRSARARCDYAKRIHIYPWMLWLNQCLIFPLSSHEFLISRRKMQHL